MQTRLFMQRKIEEEEKPCQTQDRNIKPEFSAKGSNQVEILKQPGVPKQK